MTGYILIMLKNSCTITNIENKANKKTSIPLQVKTINIES